MKQDEIIEIARQAGIVFDDKAMPFYMVFAKLVEAKASAKEREACAQVCIEHGKVWGERMLFGFQATLNDAAEAIRARVEQQSCDKHD